VWPAKLQRIVAKTDTTLTHVNGGSINQTNTCEEAERSWESLSLVSLPLLSSLSSSARADFLLKNNEKATSLHVHLVAIRWIAFT
jgi:hypothetical protein